MTKITRILDDVPPGLIVYDGVPVAGTAVYQLLVEKRCEAPAVIYDGFISTRAGSPLGNPTGSDGIDPADLFGD